MALIKCSECGKEFSDKASACPKCACPIDEQTANIKNKKKSVKDYSELTSLEKSSLRLYMRSQGENSTTEIILMFLALACSLIGFFVGFWLLFLIIGMCLLVSAYVIYINNEKKYYYKHPESIDKKKNIIKDNNNAFKKSIPWIVSGIILTMLGIILMSTDDLSTLGTIILVLGIISYIVWIYLLITKTKK